MKPYSKPELSEFEIEQCRKLKHLYVGGRTVEKQEIINTLMLSGTVSTQDRKVRDIQSIFAYYYPLINLSSESGSRVADAELNSWDDARDVFLNLCDFNSRIMKIQMRCKPLNKWLDKFMKKNGIKDTAELKNKLEEYYSE